jgi:hypothetical protein
MTYVINFIINLWIPDVTPNVINFITRTWLIFQSKHVLYDEGSPRREAMVWVKGLEHLQQSSNTTPSIR